MTPQLAYADTAVVASVLPSSRSVAVGTPATLFATILNAGTEAGTNCRIGLASAVSGQFDYQTTDPATNAPAGNANTPVDIASNGFQTFVISLTPDAVVSPLEVELEFLCDNAPAAAVIIGVNTFTFSAAVDPTPDIIALAATPASDGVTTLPGSSSASVFSVASVNVGAADTLSVTADTGAAVLPMSIAICQTDPATSLCINPATPTIEPVNVSVGNFATPTFGVFVTGSADIPFDPATNRVFVRFTDSTLANRGGTSVAVRTAPPVPVAPQLSISAAVKMLQFQWPAVAGASFYRLLEDPDGNSGFMQIGGNTTATSQSLSIAAHRFDFAGARYRVEACNDQGCGVSNTVTAAGLEAASVGFVKASNAEANDRFGFPVISADGSTFAAVALSEDSNATGVNGDEADNSASGAGAVYVFRKVNGVWVQEAYIKAAAYTPNDLLGRSMSISADGNTLVFGVQQEDSGSTGVGGDPQDNTGSNTGAVYVFARTGSSWSQQAFIKASNPGVNDFFGNAVSISDSGNTLVVGAFREDSNGAGPDADQSNNSTKDAGAAYIFTRTGSSWSQQAYLKSSSPGVEDEFGGAVHVSGDGLTVAVGAYREDSGATGVNGDDSDNSVDAAGAVYVFTENAGSWTQQAYLKPSTARAGNQFSIGNALDFSADGNTLVVGSYIEFSDTTGINGDESQPAMFTSSGAAWVFVRSGSSWGQQAFIKASNAERSDQFARSLAISSDGNTLAISALREASSAIGFDGDQADNGRPGSGAAYLFERTGVSWVQTRYIKPPITADANDRFGDVIALSGDAQTLLVASLEDSAAQGVGGDQADNSSEDSGAIFVY